MGCHLFGQFSAGMRMEDLLDIGIISVLVYVGLEWFRRRGSRSVAVGAGVCILLYLAADRLDMVLTSMLFQVGFTTVLLALIVVFQHDIRRAFERMAAWSVISGKDHLDGTTRELDALSECLSTLAQNHIGALLVFVGRESIERYVSGGVRVDGLISVPLLHSIFHPASPGHDGAVLLDGRRIQKLGVHLPLSKNLADLDEGGTRHAAALGLSERSDARVIAISEERGTIGLAEHGHLTPVPLAELRPLLERLHHCSPPRPRRGFASWVARDIPGKVFSLGLACTLWLLLAYGAETVQRTYVVPIEYRNAPAGYVIQDHNVPLAEITLSGPGPSFGHLDAPKLFVSADVSDVDPGRSGVVAVNGPTDLPSGLTAISIEPTQVPIILKRLTPSGPRQKGK